MCINLECECKVLLDHLSQLVRRHAAAAISTAALGDDTRPQTEEEESSQHSTLRFDLCDQLHAVKLTQPSGLSVTTIIVFPYRHPNCLDSRVQINWSSREPPACASDHCDEGGEEVSLVVLSLLDVALHLDGLEELSEV